MEARLKKRTTSFTLVDNENLENLLSLARRQLEQREGSPEGVRPPVPRVDSSSADVLPLGPLRHPGVIDFKDAAGMLGYLTQSQERVMTGTDYAVPVAFDREQVRSLIAHLQSWLSHGSFELGNQPVQGDSGWQDIATAPKDGKFLVLAEASGLPWPAFRSGTGQIISNAHGPVNDPNEPLSLKCSHWRPLPPAPSLSADLQTDGNGGVA